MAQKRTRAGTQTEGREPEKVVRTRAEQYLIGKRGGPREPGIEPVDFAAIRAALERDRESRIVRTLPVAGLGPLGAGLASAESIIVATMPQERAEQLSRLPQLVVEADHALALEEPALAADPGVSAPLSSTTTASISVVGGAGQTPVEGARVYLFGSTGPAQALTNANGQAQVILYGESLGSIRGLYVRPAADYWSAWVPRPVLDPDGPNVIALVPLDETFPDFPNQQVAGWGVQAMRIDQLPPSYRGRGVRVAVIDSGVANSHQDLRAALKGGFDSVGNDAAGWNRDDAGHGSHCAGIIAGGEGRGIRGIAPDAELYAFKVFPDGTLSSLIDALNRCIDLQIDVITLSVGTDQYSELLEQKLQEVKDRGIACIASAGSSGASVQFPAASPSVLAVAALGKADEFPEGSYHTAALREDGPIASEGHFSPRFTCFGPEVDVCAPGVAILSSVPPDNYAVLDGASAAAPHVAGLAALVLAHHPDFQGPYRTRDARRVERLFQILQQAARPIDLGDRDRTGAGLPDAVHALSAARAGETPVLSDELLQQLVAAFRAGRTRPGNGAAVFHQLLGALHRAGISPSFPLELAPQLGQQLGTPITDPGATFQQLRDAMRRAGLVTAKQVAAAARHRRAGGFSGASGRGESAGIDVDPGESRDLTEVMKRSGLL